MILSFWLSAQNPLSVLISHSDEQEDKNTVGAILLSGTGFLPLPSRGRCVSLKARGMPGCRETVARQPRVHTLLVRPGSWQYGGARHLFVLPIQLVSHLGVATRTAAHATPHLDRDLKITPGVEGELAEPSASLDLP